MYTEWIPLDIGDLRVNNLYSPSAPLINMFSGDPLWCPGVSQGKQWRFEPQHFSDRYSFFVLSYMCRSYFRPDFFYFMVYRLFWASFDVGIRNNPE